MAEDIMKETVIEITNSVVEKGKGMIPKVAPDPENLLAEPGDPTTKEFLWDKIVITLATLITSLSALDFITKFLSGDSSGENGGAICFIPEEFNASDSQTNFIQSFCSQGLQRTKYLTLFVPILGFLIGAVHYLWRSSVGNSFKYFFTLANKLSHVKDENTGDYPPKNVEIVKKLTEKFSLYDSNAVLQSYRTKLVLQGLIAMVAIALVAISFYFLADFDALFYSKFDCPEAQGNYNLSAWPYDNMTVSCVSVSIQYFWLLRLVDVVLFLAIITMLKGGFVFVTCWPHPKELNVKQAAIFSFITGVDSMYYVSKPFSFYFKSMCNFCCCCCCRCFKRRCSCCPRQLWDRRSLQYRRIQNEEEPYEEMQNGLEEDEAEIGREAEERQQQSQEEQYPFPRMSTDMDFFLFILYRTDNNLAHAFYEGQVSIEYKALMELDRFLIDNRDPEEDKKEVYDLDSRKEVIKIISTGWNITKPDNKTKFCSCSQTQAHNVKFASKIPIPGNIRGAIMGVALRSPTNIRAVCVSFGSLGYSKVITRVFEKVGSLNFDVDYQNEEKPVIPVGLGDGDGVFRYHVLGDIFTKPNEIYHEWHNEIKKLWEGSSKESSVYKAIPFMVIGPMTQQQQLATAHLLVGEWQRTETFADGAVLVTVELEQIEGTTPRFFKLKPSTKYFDEFDPELVQDPGDQLDWPIGPPEEEDSVKLKDVTSVETISFRKGKGVSLEYLCGDTMCKFNLKCYRYSYQP